MLFNWSPETWKAIGDLGVAVIALIFVVALVALVVRGLFSFLNTNTRANSETTKQLIDLNARLTVVLENNNRAIENNNKTTENNTTMTGRIIKTLSRLDMRMNARMVTLGSQVANLDTRVIDIQNAQANQHSYITETFLLTQRIAKKLDVDIETEENEPVG